MGIRGRFVGCRPWRLLHRSAPQWSLTSLSSLLCFFPILSRRVRNRNVLLPHNVLRMGESFAERQLQLDELGWLAWPFRRLLCMLMACTVMCVCISSSEVCMLLCNLVFNFAKGLLVVVVLVCSHMQIGRWLVGQFWFPAYTMGCNMASTLHICMVFSASGPCIVLV